MARKQYRASEGYAVRDLCHAALDHLVSAYCLFDAKSPRTLDSAGYLGHLAIELLLKAALLARRSEFPNSHDFATLLAELRSAEVDLRLSDEAESALTSFNEFSELRYPSPEGLPPIGKRDRRRVQVLVRELLEQLPGEVRQGVESVDPNRKAKRVYRKLST